MDRQKIVAANWKMNMGLAEGLALVSALRQEIGNVSCKVIIAPPLTHIKSIAESLANGFALGAQHCHYERAGAYTGEVSVIMLKEIGVSFIITGHSERRQLFAETNEMIRLKVDAILDNAVTPIFCCGESLDLREANSHMAFVETQLQESLFHLPADAIRNVVVAYEPIWAIGTGVTASPEQAQEMHAFLRDVISRQYNESIAQSISILYGGSIKADNARTIFSQQDVDGGLVGGASLQAEGFAAIVRACG